MALAPAARGGEFGKTKWRISVKRSELIDFSSDLFTLTVLVRSFRPLIKEYAGQTAKQQNENGVKTEVMHTQQGGNKQKDA